VGSKKISTNLFNQAIGGTLLAREAGAPFSFSPVPLESGTAEKEKATLTVDSWNQLTDWLGAMNLLRQSMAGCAAGAIRTCFV
jgi:hypothetical protein